jgi:DNA-binding NarL/FixJ family response regulator
LAQIKLVLSNMPDLLRDIVVNAVSAEADMEIAAEAHSVAELERYLIGAADSGRADLIVAAERDAEFARDSRRLLRSRALPPFLVLTDDGSAAYLHRTRPETSALGHLSPAALIREIRAAARLESDWRNYAEEES